MTVVAIGFFLMLAGCDKEPTQEIAGTQAAVAAAKTAGADKFMSKEFASMDELLKATLAEVQKQKASNPLSRNYAKIKTSLATIATTAAALKDQAGAEKAKVQAYVETAITKLNSDAAEAKEAVKKALKKSKTAKASVEAKVKEIEAAAAKSVEVQKLKASGDLLAARDTVNAAIAEIESVKGELGVSAQAAPPAPAVKAKAKAKGRKKR